MSSATKKWHTSIKELQRFIGFANFYWQVIKRYSSVALTQLAWSEAAQEAFNQLKLSVTTATILGHPDPKLPFVVKVDASRCRIRAIFITKTLDPREVLLK